jgi:hypothetical protein
MVGALIVASAASVRPAEAAGSASISGVVTDRDGQPISGVTVKVGAGDYGADLSTDEEGRFIASGLPAGRYVVCFYADAQDLMPECWRDIEMGQGYTRVEVTDGEAVTGIDEMLLPASYLRGTVTDTRGAPVEGALVSETWYVQDGYSWGEPTLTAADGSFEIGPVSSGEYTLWFGDTWSKRYASEWWDEAPTVAAATRLQVVRGESIDGLDAVLDDLPHITGRVRGAGGSSARGASVRVFRVAAPGVFSEVDSSPLAADGSYDVGGLQPGTYRLEFDAAPGKYRTEYWNDVRKIDSAHDVVITRTTPVTAFDAVLTLAPPVQLTRRPTISGRARVGERLRVTDGTWDVRMLRFSYQWRADGSIIPRATGRRLLLTPRLRGKHISVRVKATATTHERSPGLAATARTQPVAPTSH